MRLLLIEDDEMIGDGLQKNLRKSGYAVDWIQDGNDFSTDLSLNDYALIILDLGLPNKDGYEILKEVREKKNNIPILILTAKDAVSDRVRGLDSGADDYMLKPFALEELEARIRLLLRRKDTQKSNVISFGDMNLDIATHEFRYKGINYSLSAKEFSLMQLLMTHPQKIYSRAQLEENLYGWNEEIESNTVEVHIHQIRKKVGEKIIKNTRNVGYSLEKSK